MLSNIDRELLQRCLDRAPGGWEAFVNRYVGLIYYVASYCTEVRGLSLDEESRSDLVSEVFLRLVQDDYAVLRNFRGGSSLATYLTVVSRRVILRSLDKRKRELREFKSNSTSVVDSASETEEADWLETNEEIEQALSRLSTDEATAVRMFHLEGKSYHDISHRLGLSENSIGPYLTRARAKMRKPE